MEFKNKYKNIFGKISFKLVINFRLVQSFFSVENTILLHVIDIPIGFDHLTTFLINLFLYHHENKWLFSSRKNDLVLARKFRHVFRFLNDLCVIIENSERKKNFKNIYPEEIEL